MTQFQILLDPSSSYLPISLSGNGLERVATHELSPLQMSVCVV